MAFEDIRTAGWIILIPLYWALSVHSFRKAKAWQFDFARRIKPWQPFLFAEMLVTLSFFTVLLALAGPKVQYEKKVFDRSGIELVLGIDVSKSMLAEDVDRTEESERIFPVYNRLNRARYFALNCLSDLHGEQAGAFVFSGNGVEVIPMTRDYGYGRYVLRHINPGDITVAGSDLGAAVRTGIAMFGNADTPRIKRMILLSDGEDISPDKSSIYESAKQAARKGIRIYTVGIGMGKGVLIPIRDLSGEIHEYYTAEDGVSLKTRLEPYTLKTIASLTGGTYVPDSKTAYQDLMAQILSEARGFAETQTTETAWLDLSPFFILAGLCFFAAAVGGSPLVEKYYNRSI